MQSHSSRGVDARTRTVGLSGSSRSVRPASATVESLLTQAQVGVPADFEVWLARVEGQDESHLSESGWDQSRAWARWLTFLSCYSEHRIDDAQAQLDALDVEIGLRDRLDWQLLASTSREVLLTVGNRSPGLMDSLVVDLVRIEELASVAESNTDSLVLAYALNSAIIAMMREMLHAPARRWQAVLRELARIADSARLIGISFMNEAESMLDLALAAAAQGANQSDVQASAAEARAMFLQGADQLVELGLIGGEDRPLLRYGLAIRAVCEPIPEVLAAAHDEALAAATRGNWETCCTLIAAVLFGSVSAGDDRWRDAAREQCVEIFQHTPVASGALTYLLEHLAQRFEDGTSERDRASVAAARLEVRIRLAAADRAAGAFDQQCEVARTVLRAQRTAGLAMRDPLTGIGNRRALNERLTAAIEYCRVDERPSVVAYLDLDDFKLVNEQLSHQGGDAVLTAFAASLNGRFAAADTLYRYGGDEFVLVLDGTTVEVGVQVVGEILAGVGADSLELLSGGISATVGVTAVRPDDSVATVLHRADLALLGAKRTGKGSVVSADGPATAAPSRGRLHAVDGWAAPSS